MTAQKTISAEEKLAQKKQKAIIAISREPLVFRELPSDLFRTESLLDLEFITTALQTAKKAFENRIIQAETSQEGDEILKTARDAHQQMQKKIAIEKENLQFENLEKARKESQLDTLEEFFQ